MPTTRRKAPTSTRAASAGNASTAIAAGKTATAGRAAAVRRKPVPQSVRRRTTEAAILKSAETLFVKQGFHRTTVDQIASAANLTKGAVYVHFKDKQEVLMVLLERAEEQVIRPILDKLEEPGMSVRSKLVHYLHAWSKVAIDRRNTMFLPILMSFEFLGTNEPIEKKIAEIYEQYYSALGAVISEGQATGLIEPTRSTREHAAVLVGFMEGMLLEWLRRGKSFDGREVTDVSRRMLLEGLFSKPGPSPSPQSM